MEHGCVCGATTGNPGDRGRHALFNAAQRTHETREDLTLDQLLKTLVSIAAIDGDAEY